MNTYKTWEELSLAQHHAEEMERKLAKIEKRERKQNQCDAAVVGGVFAFDPVDRQAAMLLTKAPWWAFEPQIRKQTITNNARSTHMDTQNGGGPLSKGITLTNTGSDAINLDELAEQVALAIQQNAPKELTNLARIAVDARQVLNETTEGIGTIMGEFERTTAGALQQIRAHRMATTVEASHVINALKDVRQFFLGPDYEKETKRLAEFVELCERLQRLKESGFLDTIADTMLRLSTR